MRMPRVVSRLRMALFSTKKRFALTIMASLLIPLLLIVGGCYWYIVTGGMVARKSPSALETYIAHRLVNISIPNEAKAMKNPLFGGGDGAAAGRALYQRYCEVCHGFDGRGETMSGAWLYPPAANLRESRTTSRTDGALFYLIRNGIRNTGMPGWQLTDQETWQLVLYIRNLPIVSSLQTANPSTMNGGGSAQYVGSAACGNCHQDIYNRWKTTLMANVVRNPHEHPEAIIPDMTKHDPLVSFTTAEVAFVYGSKWKQRYFTKVGDDYFPLPAQWDVTHKKWRPYFVKEDWWVNHYPPDNLKRPTGSTCDGCHSVNYNTTTKMVTEWNVGCEKCHGPGSEHVRNPVSATIINPARLDYVQGNDTCIQCHSQGRPLANPIAGRYYDWPVGFEIGRKLSDFWKLEEHKLGETSFTHFADGTAHKNRMQGNDFVTSLMYTHGVSCFTCHDSHGTGTESLLRKPANVLCLDCHGPKSPSGPHASTIEQHTHHMAGSAGNECVACHMPKIAQTLGDVNVRSHTFRFVNPAKTDALKIPNACNACHADKSTAWATDALKTWAERSPWRIDE
jgi:predicted CXXCH cytochrome family protein